MFGILSENFSKRYELMPEQLQTSFDSMETAEVINQVAAVNNLSSEQIETVTCLTGDVLAGFVDYKDFTKKLTEEFKFDAILTQDIFKEIDRQVFLPVRDLLKQVYKPEGATEMKVEKQGTANLLEKLGKPLNVVSPKTVVPGVIESKTFSAPQEEKEFKVAPANVIDLSQKPVELKVEFQPKPIETKPIESIQSKPVIPFFKVNVGGMAPGMIVGQEQSIKPTLETPKPMDFSFGEVKPQKEKIVSDIEIQGGFGTPVKKPDTKEPMEKPGFFGKLSGIVAPKNIDNAQPIKVVNFAAPIPPPPAIPKEEKTVIPEIKTPFISVNSPLSRNIGDIPKSQPEIPIKPISQMETPNLNPISPLEIKPEKKEEAMPPVPPENVVNLKEGINLKKIKF